MLSPINLIKPMKIENKNFERVIDHKATQLYTLQNKHGMRMRVCNWGARVITLEIADRAGKMQNVVLGYPHLDDYLKYSEQYFGAAIGRVGNRIANAQFQINDFRYFLEKNDGENHLHGGLRGFHRVVWEVEEYSDSRIVFTYVSPHLEEGYPGELSVQLSYSLTDKNEFIVDYLATTDQASPVSLTHHSYFNLNGIGSEDITNHLLQINAQAISPVRLDMIPTGEQMKVDQTPFDFREPKRIGESIDKKHEQLVYGSGYDHHYIFSANKAKLINAAKVYSPLSGISMKVFTDALGMQFYSGNHLAKTDQDHEDLSFGYRSGFCLETQGFPNSVNEKSFPSIILLPEQKYTHQCIYQFGNEDSIGI